MYLSPQPAGWLFLFDLYIMCEEIEIFFFFFLCVWERLNCAVVRRHSQFYYVLYFTVQNTEVDTFSSEPLLNFIVVENIVICL